MCNNYRLHLDVDAIRQGFDEVGISLAFPEGVPNSPPRDDVRITDPGLIVRATTDASSSGTADLVLRRWSWPGPGGRPVYNFRSEGRTLAHGRCLIPADGFYEFTPHTDPKSRRKHKWLFTERDVRWLCIAGLWRASDTGEAFTMLTTAPGPDMAPYHDRQVVVLPRADWRRWLDTSIPAAQVLRPSPAGTLQATRIS